jgi:arginine decarboxylase
MSTIRVVWGGATGPTPMASYDAALAAAGIHDYNLLTVSSVVPTGVALTAPGTAPDLGPTGERLAVVQARDTVEPGTERPARAGLGWVRAADRGPGVFYEAAGGDEAAVTAAIEDGLDHAADLRDWPAADREVRVRSTPAQHGVYTSQVVCAVYGDSEPLL